MRGIVDNPERTHDGQLSGGPEVLVDVVADLILDVRNGLGEGPVWDEASQKLFWTDIPGRCLHRLEPSSGQHERWPVAGGLNSFALRRSGGLVVAMDKWLSFLDFASGVIEPITNPEAELPALRLNDGRCDRAGRFLVGSMNSARNGPTGQLWRLGLNRTAERLAGGVTVANGLAFSPDGTRMYWADSPAERVVTFAYDPETGAIGRPKPWLESGSAPGRPDGAAVDADGCYWSARWLGGCVARFTPEGRLDRLVRVPASRVTMCAFGGQDYRTMFITTARDGLSAAELAAEPLAGGVFAANVGVQGLPEPFFEG